MNRREATRKSAADSVAVVRCSHGIVGKVFTSPDGLILVPHLSGTPNLLVGNDPILTVCPELKPVELDPKLLARRVAAAVKHPTAVRVQHTPG